MRRLPWRVGKSAWPCTATVTGDSWPSVEGPTVTSQTSATESGLESHVEMLGDPAEIFQVPVTSAGFKGPAIATEHQRADARTATADTTSFMSPSFGPLNSTLKGEFN